MNGLAATTLELRTRLTDPRANPRGWKDHQRNLCDPRVNPNAAAFFMFNFCKTQDEDQAGQIVSLPPPYYPAGTPVTPWHKPGDPTWVLRFIEALDAPRLDPHNIHDEKSRRMLHTWLMCTYNLWALMWVPGYSSILISKNEDYVDDSGRSGTKVFSMFSRMRFTYKWLPDHVRKYVDFTTMSAVCPENDAWSLGRAPTEEAGRGGGAMRAFVDECAYIELMGHIHVALDPAVKFGKVYACTVNGHGNLFAEIKKNRPDGWRFFECDWKENPTYTEGLRETQTDDERERFGSHVSPKFRLITATLSDEEIAREYNREYHRSTPGMIMREYRRAIHVKPRGQVRYVPGHEIRIGLDFGMERKTYGVIAQRIASRGKMRILGVYAGEFRNAPENAAGLRDKVYEVTGLRPPFMHHQDPTVVMVPDPSALEEESGSGVPPMAWYNRAGFIHYCYPQVTGPGSVTQGNRILRALFRRDMIEIAEEVGEEFLQYLTLYRLPVDKKTGIITSNKPVHDMSSHPLDATRYVATSWWRSLDFDAGADVFTPIQTAHLPMNGDRTVLDDIDVDDSMNMPYGPLAAGVRGMR